jgi:hypothetical protein
LSIYYRIKAGIIPYDLAKRTSRAYEDKTRVKFLDGFSLWSINIKKRNEDFKHYFNFIVLAIIGTTIAWIITYLGIFPEDYSRVEINSLLSLLTILTGIILIIGTLGLIVKLFMGIPNLEAYLRWLSENND